MVKFYAAEISLAVDAVHRIGYVHRDIKPDNCLLDRSGHVVLADFGSCLKLDSDGLVRTAVAVGTPDYISPEILTAMDNPGRSAYGPECDWWSLGVCIYEMLFGTTPFYAESLVETYGKIMNHSAHLSIPPNIMMDGSTDSIIDDQLSCSNEATDLLRGLITDAAVRLGHCGFEEIKFHPFFKDVDFEGIRYSQAPYLPNVANDWDTSNFDNFDSMAQQNVAVHQNNVTNPSPKPTNIPTQLPFVGFTYTENSRLSCSCEPKTRNAVSDFSAEVYESSSSRDVASTTGAVSLHHTSVSSHVESHRRSVCEECEKLRSELDNVREAANRLQSELEEKRCIDAAADDTAVEELIATVAQLGKLVAESGANTQLAERAARLAAGANVTPPSSSMVSANGFNGDSVDASRQGMGEWRRRRLARVEQMLRSELQQALAAEIGAKRQLQSQMTEMSETLNAQQKRGETLENTCNQQSEKIITLEARVKELEEQIQQAKSIVTPSTNKVVAVVPPHESGGIIGNSQGFNEPASSHVIGKTTSEPNSPNLQKTGSLLSPGNRGHSFVTRSFKQPVRCNLCSSLLIGLLRQGVLCEHCSYVCHRSCVTKLPSNTCPPPAELQRRNYGIDPTTGIGTAYEGLVRLPRPGGIRKGWHQFKLVVCDFKMFFYMILPQNGSQSAAASLVVDMRDENFSVKEVADDEVIHASKSDVPSIFRVTATELSAPGPVTLHTVFVLTESPRERQHLVCSLAELHRVLRRAAAKMSNSFYQYPSAIQARSMYDADQFPFTAVRAIHSACFIERDRMALATDEGLYSLMLENELLIRIFDKKPAVIVQYVSAEQLIAVVGGRSRSVRLLPLLALDGIETPVHRLTETRGCVAMAVGYIHQCTEVALVVALRRTVDVYVFTKTKQRCKRLREIQLCVPASVIAAATVSQNASMSMITASNGGQNSPSAVVAPGAISSTLTASFTGSLEPRFVDFIGDRLCVGVSRAFLLINVDTGDCTASICLDDASIDVLPQRLNQALCPLAAAEISADEILLVFSLLAVYVDAGGRRTRDSEILFPTIGKSARISWPFLLLFSDAGLFVYNLMTSEWVQTACLQRAIPISHDGVVCLLPPLGDAASSGSSPLSTVVTSSNGSANKKRLVYLKNLHSNTTEIPPLPGDSDSERAFSAKKVSLVNRNDERIGKLSSERR